MIESLPTDPGCYLFKDDNAVIYVGKAKNLKKRVSSYFQKKHSDPKTQNLVQNIKEIDFIVTDNETEALILENNLIKKHQPKYNILLKDAKRYAYIQVTDEEFPRLLIARKKKDDQKFYGPFTSAALRDYVLQALRKTFQIRTCKKMPKKPCLRFHIKLCTAPCVGFVSKKEYDGQIKNAIGVLRGRSNVVIKRLEKLMKDFSKRKLFENAIEYREQINSLNYLNEKQNMERQKNYDEDILEFMVKDNHVYLMLFNINKGILENKQEFDFEYYENFLQDYLIQYYEKNQRKKELILSNELDESLKDYLKKHKVIIKIPQKGEKKDLLMLVKKNIKTTFFGNTEKLKSLKNTLRLNEIPHVIECFDISHISGSSTAGSMVQYRNGIPDKNNYRRFKIRTVEGIDDFKSIAEVVGRRYRRIKREQAQIPNLIIIDGGKGQLNAALGELKKLELKIPIISLAKKLEEIYFPGISYPVRLKDKDKALLFLREIRDEAHRFAIKYNRLLRKISGKS